ncbi:restriction endonuclease [Acinetobacter sp. RF15A]|nr:restriction endonuclease [Acinetobacter sp. RF15A]TSI20152.1 restriction endonuclease [Acinetobacter sp. RF15B]
MLKWAHELSEQRTFPDLRGFEDSDLKIQQAHKSIIELRSYINHKLDELKAEEQKQKTKENLKEIQKEIRKSLVDREGLQQQLHGLLPSVGTQQGGYDFEKWFYEALDYSDIQCRRPYKVDGRQIDGSLTIDGTTYLVELKFTKNQTGSGDIDSFKAKIDKMADNTMGIFVSMSGYSCQAIKEASGRKTTLLLLDSSHLFTFLQGIETLKNIIRRSRRHVSQTSEALLNTHYIE